LHPRETTASLAPEEGARDGLWLGILYVLGSQLISVGQAAKSLMVTSSNGALMMLASQAGRILLPPLVLSLVVEFLLGPSKAHRRGLFLMPLVICATAANLIRQFGVAHNDELTPLLVGAVWAIGLVFLTRAAIPSVEGQGEAAADGGETQVPA
jgi:hypothetical protein